MECAASQNVEVPWKLRPGLKMMNYGQIAFRMSTVMCRMDAGSGR